MLAFDNRLLSAMPHQVSAELMESGGDFAFPSGHVIAKEQLDGSQVFIVTKGIASEFQLGPSGKVSEIGMIGCEGMFPLASLLGVPGTSHIVLAQIGPLAGRRVRAKDFHRIISDHEDARLILQKYAYAFMAQICSTLMSAELVISARLARWLLMCHDRVPGDEINITHDMLALMAVAHRPTISNALDAMRKDGLIETGRASIIIKDRAKLIAAAQGAYGSSESYWQSVIGPIGNGEHKKEEIPDTERLGRRA